MARWLCAWLSVRATTPAASVPAPMLRICRRDRRLVIFTISSMPCTLTHPHRSNCSASPESRREGQPTGRQLHEVRSSEPVVAQRFDVGNRGLDLALTVAQQLEDADLHRVVLKLSLGHDPLLQRQDDVTVVERPIPRPDPLVLQGPSHRADTHGQTVVLLLSAPQLGRGPPDLRLPLVEQWNGKREHRPDLPGLVPFPLSSGAE